MNSIMTMLMLNCEKASELVIKKEEKNIGTLNKMRLWLHVLICKFCKEFEDQNEFININMKNQYGEDCQSHQMCEEKKKAMKEALIKETKQVL